MFHKDNAGLPMRCGLSLSTAYRLGHGITIKHEAQSERGFELEFTPKNANLEPSQKQGMLISVRRYLSLY